jgi:hypothetical protein
MLVRIHADVTERFCVAHLGCVRISVRFRSRVSVDLNQRKEQRSQRRTILNTVQKVIYTASRLRDGWYSVQAVNSTRLCQLVFND